MRSLIGGTIPSTLANVGISQNREIYRAVSFPLIRQMSKGNTMIQNSDEKWKLRGVFGNLPTPRGNAILRFIKSCP
jgi:hypothetical protein